MNARERELVETVDRIAAERDSLRAEVEQLAESVRANQPNLDAYQERNRELQAEVEQLKAELDSVWGSDPCPKCGAGVRAGCYGCEAAELRAEVERLRAVLRPFAAVARSYKDTVSDTIKLTCYQLSDVDYDFTLGDLRTAARALDGAALDTPVPTHAAAIKDAIQNTGGYLPTPAPTCPTCNGTGRWRDGNCPDMERCPDCKGAK